MTFSTQVRAILREPTFLAAAGILVVSAICLNGAKQFLQLHFKKNPVPLQIKLDRIPADIGNWHQISTDTPLGEDLVEALDTKEYIFRDYVDDRVITTEQIKALRDMSETQRRAEMLRLHQANMSKGVLRVAVTYYTGRADTVAHIPDRCYINGGFDVVEARDKTWMFNGRTVQAKLTTFEEQTGRTAVRQNVAYFFVVNGDLAPNPLAVRARLQRLWEKYGYYAKIEMMSMQDQESAGKEMENFISQALPEIEKCFKDWKSLK